MGRFTSIRAPQPLPDDIRASAEADGHPYVFCVLLLRDDEWRAYAHYRDRDPHLASRMAHDLAASLQRLEGRRRVMVASYPIGDSPACLSDWQASEVVQLHDGPEVQHLVPGVAPVPLALRQCEALARARSDRRGRAALPEGGLFDETDRAQGRLL